MFKSNKCCIKNILCFARKLIKTQGSPGGIQNIEIWVLQNLYHFVPTFFPVNLNLWHQKIVFGTGHQDIGQKL